MDWRAASMIAEPECLKFQTLKAEIPQADEQGTFLV